MNIDDGELNLIGLHRNFRVRILVHLDLKAYFRPT